MADYNLYKPLIDKLNTHPHMNANRLLTDQKLSHYISTLKFYGEPLAEDKMVYILLYLNSNNISAVRQLLSMERSRSSALNFCKEVLRCIYCFSNPFEDQSILEELYKSLFDRTDEFIAGINVPDSKRFIRFIVELLWLLLQIRSHVLDGTIVEGKLISTVQTDQAETEHR